MAQTRASGDLYQDGPNTSDQFIRKWSLELYGTLGGSWILSNSETESAESGGTSTVQDALRITFQTRQVNFSSRGFLDVKVYNLATPPRDLAALYNRVILRAGYKDGNYGIIFDGTILWSKEGRERTLVDTFLQIRAQDGDFVYNLATATLSYKAATTPLQMVNTLIGIAEGYGAKLGKVLNMSTNPLARGAVHVGMLVDQFLKHGQTDIQQRVLNVFDPRKEFPEGDPVIFNAFSGLVSMPEATAVGIEFDALINPAVQIHTTVVIDEEDINRFGINPNVSGAGEVSGSLTGRGPGFEQRFWFTRTTADGKYSVVKIEYQGDSRGVPWYMHVTGWPRGQARSLAIPLTEPFYDNGPTEPQIHVYSGDQGTTGGFT